MKKLILIIALAAAAGAPALALQDQHAVGVPQTFHTKLNLYRETNYNGELWTVETPSSTVHTDWNIRSIAVHPGDRWQICARARYRDPCIVLDRSVPDATMIGVEGQIGSARLVTEEPSSGTAH
jgi:hypothetical protein